MYLHKKKVACSNRHPQIKKPGVLVSRARVTVLAGTYGAVCLTSNYIICNSAGIVKRISTPRLLFPKKGVAFFREPLYYSWFVPKEAVGYSLHTRNGMDKRPCHSLVEATGFEPLRGERKISKNGQKKHQNSVFLRDFAFTTQSPTQKTRSTCSKVIHKSWSSA